MESALKFNKPKFKILCVDDSDGSHKVINYVLFLYAETHPNFKYEVDHFYSYSEFMEKRAHAYDAEIIDWNLGPSKQDRGDEVIKHLGHHRSKCTIIYTGMSHVLSDQDFLNFIAEHKISPVFKGRVEEVAGAIHGLFDVFLTKS